LKLAYVPSKDMIADGLTKALKRELFSRFVVMLRMEVVVEKDALKTRLAMESTNKKRRDHRIEKGDD